MRLRLLDSWLSLLRAPIIGLMAVAFGFSSFGGSPQTVSVVNSTVGAPAGGGGDSGSPVVSADRRYVLFASSANNLVLTSNNSPWALMLPPKMNVYLRDRANGTTTLVSVNLAGTGGGNGDSFPVDISTNGQFVLFESSATNLAAGVTNNRYNNVYVRDLVNGTNILVSVNTNGVGGNGDCRSAVMTQDGHFVAFVSGASDLIAGDSNGIPDIFVRDLQAGLTILASSGARGLAGAASSELPDITPDGRYVAFYSTATNLVSGVNTAGEVYVTDLIAGTTTRVSGYAHTAVQQRYNNTNSLSLAHVISDDGQFIAYEAIYASTPSSSGIILRYSQATGNTDVVATNGAGFVGTDLDHHELDMTPDGRFISYVANVGSTTAIYQWDALSNTTNLVSGTYDSNTVPAGSNCQWPVMDSTGRYVAFLASASGLTTNGDAGYHIYQRDMQGGVTRLVDANSNGVPSTGGGVMTIPHMSTDGSLIAFDLPDTTLVPGDNNRAYDVFAVNPSLNTVELISCAHPDLSSLTPSGASALSLTSLSGNARYVAFSSQASNLVPNDANNCWDVFVRDALLGSNILVSVDTNGVLAGSGVSFEPSISSDGRYVAFTSVASNLVVGDTNRLRDVFVRDLQLGQTTLVSVNYSGTGPGNADSYSPTISTNGRYVLFHSLAGNLVAGAGSYDNLFWRDMQTGVMRAFTTNSSTAPSAGAMTPDGKYVVAGTASTPLYVWNAQLGTRVYTNSLTAILAAGISPDGTHIGFVAGSPPNAADIVSNTRVTLAGGTSAVRSRFGFTADSRFMVYVGTNSGTSNFSQIYLYDFVNLSNVLISQSTNGTPGNGNSDSPVISPDGRFVAYHSFASNLGPDATNGISNLYLYDSQSGTTLILSGNTPGNGRSSMPVFSADSQTLVFQSWDAGWAAQDFNQWSDIFALSLYSTNAQPAFSAGILPAAVNGQAPVITWPITPGKNYLVQYKNQLSDPVWQVLNGSITISGNQESMTDSSPSSTQRFYRIVSY